MNPRSLVILILVFALVAGAVWTSQLNRDAVTLRLPGLAPMSAPLWVVLFLTLLVGVFLALIYSLVLSSREAMDRWRQARGARAAAGTEAEMNAGVRALLRGEHSSALAHFDRASSADAANAEAWLLGGDAARALGEIDGAMERHQRAQGLVPGDTRAAEAVALDAEAAGDSKRALSIWQRLIEKIGPEPRFLRRACDLSIAAEDWEGAIALQRQLLSARPDDAGESRALLGLRTELGRRQLAAGSIAEALGSAQELVSEAPDFEPGQILLGEARIASGDFEQAARDWETGVEATGSVELLRRLANSFLDNEQPEEAIRALREAAAALRGSRAIAARILLARLYYRLELIDEAAELLEELSHQVVESPVVSFYLAKTWHRRGRADDAYALLKDTIRMGGYLDHRFRCEECHTLHGEHSSRCGSCGRWGTLRMDLSTDARQAEEAVAPVV